MRGPSLLLAMLLLAATAALPSTPLAASLTDRPWLDATKSVPERVAALLPLLSTDEKIKVRTARAAGRRDTRDGRSVQPQLGLEEVVTMYRWRQRLVLDCARWRARDVLATLSVPPACAEWSRVSLAVCPRIL